MKMLVLTFGLTCFSLNCIADPNERILESFKRLCPNAKQVSWSEEDSYFVVHCTQREETTVIWFNNAAKVLKTLRYYQENLLPPFIKARVQQKYKWKKIFGVTEIASEQEIKYEIVLQDDKNWFYVSSDAYGNSTITKKYNKA